MVRNQRLAGRSGRRCVIGVQRPREERGFACRQASSCPPAARQPVHLWVFLRAQAGAGATDRAARAPAATALDEWALLHDLIHQRPRAQLAAKVAAVAAAGGGGGVTVVQACRAATAQVGVGMGKKGCRKRLA